MDGLLILKVEIVSFLYLAKFTNSNLKNPTFHLLIFKNKKKRKHPGSKYKNIYILSIRLQGMRVLEQGSKITSMDYIQSSITSSPLILWIIWHLVSWSIVLLTQLLHWNKISSRIHTIK